MAVAEKICDLSRMQDLTGRAPESHDPELGPVSKTAPGTPTSLPRASHQACWDFVGSGICERIRDMISQARLEHQELERCRGVGISLDIKPHVVSMFTRIRSRRPIRSFPKGFSRDIQSCLRRHSMSDFMLVGVHAPSQASEEGWKALCAIRWAWVRPPFMQNLFP